MDGSASGPGRARGEGRGEGLITGPRRAQLIRGARVALGRPLTAEELSSLERYLALIATWSRVHRLTGSTEPGWLIEHVILDSLLFARALGRVPETLLDIGPGAGAPGLPLKIVGEGRDRAALMAQAGPTIEFLGQVPEDEKFHLYARCRAAVFPAEDDFGIAQVEVQAAGRPAIALARGGALDTVVDGVTGVLFPDQTVESLIEAVRRFERLHFSTGDIVRQARRFSRARFKEEMRDLIERELEARRAMPGAPVSEEVQRVWS
uniref:Glycosyltransferase n=1 Tax=Thermorudis peleae TaxID=1382356 RepID=A0A831TD24_9BACT